MAKKKSSSHKTLAMRLLEGKKVRYEARTYDPDRYVSATEVAEAIGMPAQQVFKTLVVQTDKGRPLLAVIPADRELDLKALAGAAGVKKVRMATQADAERWTGLQKGGISALALLNKGFRVFLDDSAEQFDIIAMSAGERGVQVLLAPDDFLRLTRARLAPLVPD
ncbi:MAG: Cys-tRNA(Pro) deacylase [Caldilineae bacterium]|nr:MAG: Cys-tRNA(Pro) deacylase [Caldilineae bacterium]